MRRCSGQGNKQTTKKVSVTIPKGVDDGTRIRLSGKGEAGTRGGVSGDLYLFVNIYSEKSPPLKPPNPPKPPCPPPPFSKAAWPKLS